MIKPGTAESFGVPSEFLPHTNSYQFCNWRKEEILLPETPLANMNQEVSAERTVKNYNLGLEVS